MIENRVSSRDSALTATVLTRTPLRYADGADASQDRPEHVRAGSSLTWFGNRLAVIQDDAHFIALIDPKQGRVDAMPLPAGEEGLRQFDDLRGNKRYKLDLEACLSVPSPTGDMLLAFGSGSKKRRESVVRMSASGFIETIEAHELYHRFREARAFSGSELNLEGAVFIDGWVRFFNRGNGENRDGLLPLDASCDVFWAQLEAYLQAPDSVKAPELHRIVQYDLGTLGGIRLTFTDAAKTELGLLYVASAEDSQDAVTDGCVAGSVIGVLDESSGCRWTELREPDGSLFAGKVEGLCADRNPGGRIFVVIDADDATRPSELCEVALSGFWT